MALRNWTLWLGTLLLAGSLLVAVGCDDDSSDDASEGEGEGEEGEGEEGEGEEGEGEEGEGEEGEGEEGEGEEGEGEEGEGEQTCTGDAEHFELTRYEATHGRDGQEGQVWKFHGFGHTELAEGLSRIWVENWQTYGGMMQPGALNLGEGSGDYTTCSTCIQVHAGCQHVDGKMQCEKVFMPAETGGRVVIDELGTDDCAIFGGRLEGVQFREVAIDPNNLTTTVVQGGETFCLEDFEFAGEVNCVRCDGHGILENDECECEVGYIQDPEDAQSCIREPFVFEDGVAVDVILNAENPSIQKLNFRTMEILPSGAEDWDIWAKDVHGGDMDGPVIFLAEGVGAVDLGEVSYHDVTEAPEDGYVEDDEGASVYGVGATFRNGGGCSAPMTHHVYALRLADGSYAKLEVLLASTGNLTMRCYRQPDGGRNLSTHSPE